MQLWWSESDEREICYYQRGWLLWLDFLSQLIRVLRLINLNIYYWLALGIDIESRRFCWHVEINLNDCHCKALNNNSNWVIPIISDTGTLRNSLMGLSLALGGWWPPATIMLRWLVSPRDREAPQESEWSGKERKSHPIGFPTMTEEAFVVFVTTNCNVAIFSKLE